MLISVKHLVPSYYLVLARRPEADEAIQHTRINEENQLPLCILLMLLLDLCHALQASRWQRYFVNSSRSLRRTAPRESGAVSAKQRSW